MTSGFASIRSVHLAFGSAFAILLALGVFSCRSIAASADSVGWVGHTYEVRERLQNMQLAMESIVASVRGFVLTGTESELDVYHDAKLSVVQDAAAVRALTVDNRGQQSRLPALEGLAAESFDRQEANISLRRAQGLEMAADAIRRGSGRQRVAEYQAVVTQMQDEERRLLTLRLAEVKQRLGRTQIILILGTILGLLITLAAGWSVQRDNAKRAIAEAALREGERKYRMLVHGIKDYAIYMLSPRGEICSWNPGAELMTGYTYEEIAGQNVSRFFAVEDIKRGKPEQILRLAAASDWYEEQGVRVRKDGSRYPVDTSLTASRDAAGNLHGFSVICRDLSGTKESEAKYRGLLEAAPDAMVVVNQGGEIVLLNVQAEKQFGYRRDELIGQKVTNIIPEGFAERLVADDLRSAEDALAQQIGTGIELIARRKDGSEFPIEIMLSPLESAEGTLVTAAIRNISVRKEAETHLAQMEGRYRGLLEAAPDAMVVVNQGGEIVLLNVQAEKQFGYRRDELIGQKVTNIIPEGFAERLVADDLRSAEDALAQQIGTGIELVARRKDGSEFPIEIMLSPLESAEGILVTAAIRNISVRKEAEKHLAQMEGRYRGTAGSRSGRHGGGESRRRDRALERAGGEAVRIPPRRAHRPEGDQHHSRRLRRTADRRRSAIRGRCAGAADRDRHRAHRAAQGRQRVSDRDHAEPAGKRRGHPGHGGDPQHQRAQGSRKAPGADGGQIPRAAGSGSGRHGGGEPGRRDRAVERAGGEAVRIPPR